jgi:hypothetical protein
MPRGSRPIVRQDGVDMGYLFEPMSQWQARSIAAWRYDPPYDFTDAMADPILAAALRRAVQPEILRKKRHAHLN